MGEVIQWISEIWVDLPRLIFQEYFVGIITAILMATFVYVVRIIQSGVGSAGEFFTTLRKSIFVSNGSLFGQVALTLKNILVLAYFAIVFGLPLTIAISFIYGMLYGDPETFELGLFLVALLLVLPLLVIRFTRRWIGLIGHYLLAPIVIIGFGFVAFFAIGLSMGYATAFILSVTSDSSFAELSAPLLCSFEEACVMSDEPDPATTVSGLSGVAAGLWGIWYSWKLWIDVLPEEMGLAQR